MQGKTVRLHIILCTFLIVVSLPGCSSGAKSVTAGSKFLYVELWTNDACPRVGETVILRATATNGGSDTKIIGLANRPVLDLIVGNPDTSQFRWSAGKPLTADLTRLELEPGETKSIEMQWSVEEPFTYVSAYLIPDTQSIGNPFTAGLVLGTNCTNFIGP